MEMLLGALNLVIEDGKRWTRQDWEHYLEVEALTPYNSFFDASPSTVTMDSALPLSSHHLSYPSTAQSCCDSTCTKDVSVNNGSYPPGLYTLDEEQYEVQTSEALKILTDELLQHRPPLAPQRTNLTLDDQSSPGAQVFK